jgi:PAS domain S-box-containing protein
MIKILVVEDERIVAEDIRDSLGRLGYDVPAIVGSGRAAVAAAEETQPDLVLMDIVLKDEMDGIEAAKQIQDRFGLPVVFLTAHADEGTLQRAKVTGPFGYILKPFGEQELSIAIEIALYKYRTEARLIESENRFRELAEKIREVFWSFDWKEQKVLYVSPAYEDVWGRPAKALLEDYDEWARSIHPDDVEYATASFEQIVLTGGGKDREYRIVRPDGTVRWISDRGFAVYDQDGTIQRIVGIAEDVTERKQAEAAMIRASRLEATATLAGGVAHKVNNLMSGVLGYAELLKLDLPQDADSQEMLDTISRSAEQASDLATQMLAFAQSGRPKPQIVDLSNTVQGILLAQELESRAGIEIKVDTDPDIWSVLADPAQMGQVFLSLFTNAVEAIEDSGQITITTRNVSLDKPRLHLQSGPYVCLSVKDTGCGMSAEVRDRAFEPFFTTKFQGRGLGLAAAYGIVRNHGGDIVVYSEEGQGATFEVYVPAVP